MDGRLPPLRPRAALGSPSRWVCAAAVAILPMVLAASCSRRPSASAGPSEAALSVQVTPAAVGDLTRTLEVSGDIKTLHDVAIAAETMARITYVAGREGDRVRAGQVLIRMDASQVVANLQQARAQAEAARVRLAQAQNTFQLTRVSSSEGTEQARQGVESAQARLAQAQSALDLTRQTVKNSIAQAEAGLDQARAKADQARSSLAQVSATTVASVSGAEAQVKAAQARLDEFRHGARTQEREIAREAVNQAVSQVENARKDLARMVALRDAGAVSQQQVDAAQLRYDLSVSQQEAAMQHLSLTEEGTRPEEIRQAEEAVSTAQSVLDQARAARAAEDQKREDLRMAEQGVVQSEAALRIAESQRLQIDSREKDVEAAQAGVATAQSQLAVAKSGPLRVNVSREDIRAAEAAVRGADASVAVLQAELAKRTIHSPVNGAITRRAADPGEVASPGMELLHLVSDTALYFEAQVSELSIATVSVGQAVSTSVDGVPGVELEGRVLAVVPAGDPSSRDFTIRIAIPFHSGVRPGMFARGKIPVESAHHAVLVPEQAIIHEDSAVSVFVVQANTARRRAVDAGVQAEGWVEVRSGVKEGEKVVVMGQTALSDGAAVHAEQASELVSPPPAGRS